MDTYRYSYQCYRMLRNLDEVGMITWATNVKEFLYMYCLGYVWFYDNVGDEGLFFKAFRQRLIDCSIQDWSSKLNGKGKARQYKYSLPNFGLACYRKYNIPLNVK